jgi:hypothetical protein
VTTAISVPDETFRRVERASSSRGLRRRGPMTSTTSARPTPSTAIAGLPNDAAFSDAAAAALSQGGDGRSSAAASCGGPISAWPEAAQHRDARCSW